MDIGLLWHDSSGKELARKVNQAARRYRERFGEPPDVCYVHPAQLPDGDCQVGDIRVRSSQRILPHHFWLGLEKGAR